jgi:hypothetical protein
MEIEPDQETVGEAASDVQEAASPVESVVAPKKVRKTAAKATVTKKATVKRKKATAPRKRRKPAAEPVAPPPPLTLEELKEQGVQAKREIVGAVIEPAVEALGSLSQTVRDTIGGALSGLLSRKRRGG